jgi:hypothetical protein
VIHPRAYLAAEDLIPLADLIAQQALSLQQFQPGLRPLRVVPGGQLLTTTDDGPVTQLASSLQPSRPGRGLER